MTLSWHIVFSLPLGASVYALHGDPELAAISMAASVLIDVDHGLDYIVENRKINSVYEMIRSVFSGAGKTKLYCFLHSWEMLGVLAIITTLFHSPTLEITLAGLGYHMICDQIYWTVVDKKLKPQAYFIFIRARYNYELAALTVTERT